MKSAGKRLTFLLTAWFNALTIKLGQVLCEHHLLAADEKDEL